MHTRHPHDSERSGEHAPARNLVSRRRFLILPAAIAAIGILESVRARIASAAARLPRSVHPEPRPGVTADKILAPDLLKTDKARKLYDQAREIPGVLDGIHCYCDCHDDPMNHRSLLSCFESDQAAGCYACGAEARLVHELHGEGRTLADIRSAVDRKFG